MPCMLRCKDYELIRIRRDLVNELIWVPCPCTMMREKMLLRNNNEINVDAANVNKMYF